MYQTQLYNLPKKFSFGCNIQKTIRYFLSVHKVAQWLDNLDDSSSGRKLILIWFVHAAGKDVVSKKIVYLAGYGSSTILYKTRVQ